MSIPPIARDAFLERLEQFIAQADPEESGTGLLLVDLTNLALINHRHSFNLGDAFLRETALQLDALTTTERSVFRIGSHTFGVILPNMTHAAFLAMAVSRVQRALEAALFVDNALTPVRLSIGVALAQKELASPLTMLARAEVHLRDVRRGSTIDLEEVLREAPAVVAADNLEQPFEDALYNNEFMLYYQPQIDLATGRLSGAEALLRWIHEEHGFVSPERVVKLAENAGRTFELAKSVANVAARQIAEWTALGLDVPVAVNVSADLVSNPELPRMLIAALGIWGAPLSQLTVEITEQAVVTDLEAGTHALSALRDIGAQISIDDFGTGYSSLSYFRDIPASELKVDRSFVMRLLESEQDRDLVRIIIEIAHLYGMRVVAEGVEDYETYACLREMGCDVMQGYLIARPMPAQDFLQWQADWRAADGLARLSPGD